MNAFYLSTNKVEPQPTFDEHTSNEHNRQWFFPTASEISVATKMQVIALLNFTLATTVDLKTQIKQAQWNVVVGSNCEPLQELFADMAIQLEEYIDMFAERIKILGGRAIVTSRVAAELSMLPEYPHHILNDFEHVTAVAQRLILWAGSLLQGSLQADKWGDAETTQVYTEVFRVIEQRLWLLEAHLQAAILAGQHASAISR